MSTSAASSAPGATAASAASLKAKGGTYHCDYCRKDISHVARIKCAECVDFDLCMECFCSGASVLPHRPYHAYRVIEHVRQPLFDPRWGADEELLLLEAIEIFGFGNWGDIAEHVSSKSKTECEQHYLQVYLSSDTAPLPDISKALTQTAKTEQQQAQVKQEDAAAQAAAAASPSEASAASAMQLDSSVSTKDESKLSIKQQQQRQSIGVSASSSSSSPSSSGRPPKAGSVPVASKPKPKSGLGHLVGYIPSRGDFDQEYEQEAELILADMEFKDEDTKWERELKLRVLEIYNSKLDARAERKRFILERGLLERKERKRGKEEREIWNNMRVFARFHSAEEHEQFVSGLVNEARLRRRIEKLQQWRSSGVKTLKEGEKYDDDKKRRDERKRQQQTQTQLQQGMTGAGLQQSASSSSKKRPLESLQQQHDDASITTAQSSSSAKLPKTASSLAPFPIDSFEQSELLSEREKQLCSTLHLLPVHYLSIKQRLVSECFVRGFLKEGQARQLIRIDVNKTKELFDFFVSVGWVNAQEMTAQQPQQAAGGNTASSSTASSANVSPSSAANVVSAAAAAAPASTAS